MYHRYHAKSLLRFDCFEFPSSKFDTRLEGPLRCREFTWDDIGKILSCSAHLSVLMKRSMLLEQSGQ